MTRVAVTQLSILILLLAGNAAAAGFAMPIGAGPAAPTIEFDTTDGSPGGRLESFSIQTSLGRLEGELAADLETTVAIFRLVESPEILSISMGSELGNGLDSFTWYATTYGQLRYVSTDTGWQLYDSTISDCAGLSEEPVYLAVAEVEAISRALGENVALPIDSLPPAVRELLALTEAVAMIPRLIDDCQAYISRPSNGICWSSSYYETCVECCDNQHVLTPICAGFSGLIPGGGIACQVIKHLALRHCKNECEGKPPAPGPGETCGSFGCEGGTCHNGGCPPGLYPNAGACSQGAVCCHPNPNCIPPDDPPGGCDPILDPGCDSGCPCVGQPFCYCG